MLAQSCFPPNNKDRGLKHCPSRMQLPPSTASCLDLQPSLSQTHSLSTLVTSVCSALLTWFPYLYTIKPRLLQRHPQYGIHKGPDETPGRILRKSLQKCLLAHLRAFATSYWWEDGRQIHVSREWSALQQLFYQHI